MGGLAAMFGGLGQAAQNFGDKQRLLNLQQWATTQKQMMDGYDEAIKELGPMSSPELMASLHQGRASLAKVQPGDHKATAKAVQDFQNLLAVHPNTVAAVAPPGPPKPQPGPAAPGETPGMGTLSNMISNPGAAAAPASSPVQPSRQTAPGPSGLPEQSLAAPPAPASAAAAPEASSIPPVGAAPVGASQAPASPSMTMPIPPNPLVDRFMQPGLMPPSLATAVQPSMSNRADLERWQMMTNERLRILGASGVMDNPNVPDYMRALLPLEAGGINAPMYGAATLMRSHQINVDATGMPPEEKALYGIDPDGTGHWTVDKDGSGRPTGRAVQGWSGVGTGVTPESTMFQYNKNNPTDPLASRTIQGPGGVPAMATSMTTPHEITDAFGVKRFQTPARASMKLPDLGSAGINPAMAQTVTGTDTQQLPTGETVTRRTAHKVFGVDTTPRGSSVPTHDPAGNLLGNTAFKDRVKTITDTLMIPNQSESQKNNAFKQLAGPERSPLAETVRIELAKRQAADPGPFSFDGSQAALAQRATQTLSHIDTINSLIAKLDSAHQLGPVMSRWNEFMTSKLGEDLTKNQDYVNLANQLDLLTKAMGFIHGGSRGGGSIQMVESFAKKLNVNKMDADTLRSAVNAEKDWIQTYASPKQTTMPKGTLTSPPGVPKIGDQFGGGRITAVERIP